MRILVRPQTIDEYVKEFGGVHRLPETLEIYLRPNEKELLEKFKFSPYLNGSEISDRKTLERLLDRGLLVKRTAHTFKLTDLGKEALGIPKPKPKLTEAQEMDLIHSIHMKELGSSSAEDFASKLTLQEEEYIGTMPRGFNTPQEWWDDTHQERLK